MAKRACAETPFIAS